MSLRSRARALQQQTGMTYQQALERIRALGSAPADLARKTGWPLKVCDARLVAAQDEPSRINVILQAVATPHAVTVGGICEELRTTTLARAVCIMDARGGWLAMAGFDSVKLLALPRELRVGNREPESWTLDSQGGLHVYSSALVTGARLFVLFDDRSSVGLVRLRVRGALRGIDRLLEPSVFRPPSGGDSGSGAPAQISAFDGLFDRSGKKVS